MDVQILGDGSDFASLAAAFFEQDPFSTNVIATVLAAGLDGVRPPGPDEIWCAVGEGGHVVGLAMHTPPHPLFVSRMPTEAAAALAEALAERGRQLPGVNGEVSSSGAFAAAWTERTGCASAVDTSRRMYRLAALQPPATPGESRTAGHADLDLVIAWFHAFHDEATPGEPAADLDAVTEHAVGSGTLALWVDGGEIVSLAGRRPAEYAVARIGPVYTPPSLRRKGYGGAVSAAATQTALDDGAAHVVLYADLANPISNGVYQRIGYVADHDADSRTFEQP